MPKKIKKIDHNLLTAFHAAEDKKALDIVILDLKEYHGITDYFIICSGTSNRHVQGICDGIRDMLGRKSSELGGKKTVVFKGMEGYNTANWILIDYVDFVIHIFKEETREFYDLERLWGEAKKILPG